jgi:hypothetical protein
MGTCVLDGYVRPATVFEKLEAAGIRPARQPYGILYTHAMMLDQCHSMMPE